MQTVITGTGSFVPPVTKCNKDFVGQAFYDENQKLITRPGEEIIEKFEVITGICERRYSPGNMTASFMGMLAAKIAIDDAGIDAETIDQVIVAHNFGDTGLHAPQSSMVPSLASRIKKELGIKAPGCVAYDILFGCPGWLQGLIQADAFGKAGVAKTCLVIGTETLSRVLDVYDRDSMIYSDGAGAVVTQIQSSPEKKGMLKSVSASFTKNEADFIYMGASNNPAVPGTNLYLKMQGRKVYEFALKQVPAAIKQCLDKNEIHLEQIKKIFI
ncbi:MAG TPA: 3-oxoacyl-ACP synthase III family protein, partial [Chitinophagaceae bacterium]|nr:3-oxoacyl-ACP synthase III family protein [Chitinophagaceae bacterium]